MKRERERETECSPSGEMIVYEWMIQVSEVNEIVNRVRALRRKGELEAMCI